MYVIEIVKMEYFFDDAKMLDVWWKIKKLYITIHHTSMLRNNIIIYKNIKFINFIILIIKYYPSEDLSYSDLFAKAEYTIRVLYALNLCNFKFFNFSKL